MTIFFNFRAVGRAIELKIVLIDGQQYSAAHQLGGAQVTIDQEPIRCGHGCQHDDHTSQIGSENFRPRVTRRLTFQDIAAWLDFAHQNRFAVFLIGPINPVSTNHPQTASLDHVTFFITGFRFENAALAMCSDNQPGQWVCFIGHDVGDRQNMF